MTRPSDEDYHRMKTALAGLGQGAWEAVITIMVVATIFLVAAILKGML